MMGRRMFSGGFCLVAIASFAVMGGDCSNALGIRGPQVKASWPGRTLRLKGGGGGEPEAGGRLIGERILESLEKAEASAAEYARIDMAKLEEFASSMDIAKVNAHLQIS